jgi:hypothetical protein
MKYSQSFLKAITPTMDPFLGYAIHHFKLYFVVYYNSMLGGVPVPTAWRVLGLWIAEQPPVMEVNCEYIE